MISSFLDNFVAYLQIRQVVGGIALVKWESFSKASNSILVLIFQASAYKYQAK